MTEQDLYKNILSKVINQTEQLQFKNTREIVQHLVDELHDNQLPSNREYLN
ncbi:hypothetical protein [Aquibacillus kalidii]|uniref:hypothetical protein n=1 Tax=Aquibacillus kalidii TaxID=2762597 RepID=UPI00164519BF|nr:hypothetical protein [Aquibacillus kalidii]